MKHVRKVLLVATFFILFLSQTSAASAQRGQACTDCLNENNGSMVLCVDFCGGGAPVLVDDPNDAIIPIEAPTAETFDALNPLQIGGGETVDDKVASAYAEELSTPGGIVTRLLDFIFPIAGLILFLMISWGGFEVLVGSGDSSKVQAGKQRVTAAIVGFLVLFSSYWLIQIVEAVFGVVIF